MPAEDLATIEAELAAFDPELIERARLIVGSKLDAARDERRRQLQRRGGRRGLAYFEVSAVSGEGLDELVEGAPARPGDSTRPGATRG